MDSKTRKQEQNKANYERNRERIKQRNLERYHTQKKLKVAGDTASARSDMQANAEKILVPARRPEKAGRPFPKLRLLSAESNASQHNEPDHAEKAQPSLPIETENGCQPDDAESPAKSGLEVDKGSNQRGFEQHHQFQNEKTNVNLKKADGSGFLTPPTGASRKFLSVAIILFRVALTIGLTVLEIQMLKSLMESPEVVSNLALPLSVAAALSLQSLTLMKFEGVVMNFIRRGIFGIFFCWMVTAQGYHVFADARLKLENAAPTEKRTALLEREAQTVASLEWAKKMRSWQDVNRFAEDLRQTRAAIDQLPRAEVLGVTSDWAVGVGAALAIVLRALLLAVSALNTAKLREHLYRFF